MEPEIIIPAVIFADSEDDRLIFLRFYWSVNRCRSPPDLRFAQKPNFRKPEERQMLFNQESYGKRIKALRDQKGLTQEQLAEALHISDVHLRRLEAGRSTGSVELVVEIAEFFDVSLDYLLLGVNRGSGKLQKDIRAIAGSLIKIAEEIG